MTDQNNSSSDQISLSSIKIFFYQIFSLLFKVLDFVGNVVKRGFLVIIIGSILGILGGYLFYKYAPQYFKTEMIVQNSDLTRRIYFEMIDGINSQIQSRSYSKLSNALGMSEEKIKGIDILKVVGVNDESLLQDTSTRIHQSFKIVAQLNNNLIIDSLQSAIINYLNKNPYSTKSKPGIKKFYEERLNFVESEIRKIDSLIINFSKSLLSSQSSPTFYNNAFNPAKLFVESNILAKEQEFLRRWLSEDQQSIILIDGFKTPENAQSVSRRASLIIGAMSGFLLGFLIASLIAIKSNFIAKN